MAPSEQPRFIGNARLPRWLLPSPWPVVNEEVALALLKLEDQRVREMVPMRGDLPLLTGGGWDIRAALVLPGFVDAHTHLDKALTAARLGAVAPGLLGRDCSHRRGSKRWTAADVHERASHALAWAWNAGTRHPALAHPHRPVATG